jgi:hypothetical protein
MRRPINPNPQREKGDQSSDCNQHQPPRTPGPFFFRPPLPESDKVCVCALNSLPFCRLRCFRCLALDSLLLRFAFGLRFLAIYSLLFSLTGSFGALSLDAFLFPLAYSFRTLLIDTYLLRTRGLSLLPLDPLLLSQGSRLGFGFL